MRVGAQKFAVLASVAFSAVLGLSACQNKGGGGDKQPATVPPPAVVPNNNFNPNTSPLGQNIVFPFNYLFTDLGRNCTTNQKQVFNLMEYCSLLQDENFNRNCALEKRNEQRNAYCNGNVNQPIDPNNPNFQPQIPNGYVGVRCMMVNTSYGGHLTRTMTEQRTFVWNMKDSRVEVLTRGWTVGRRFANVKARLEPASLGSADTIEIIAERGDRNAPIVNSVKGFIGRDVILDIDDPIGERGLKVTCQPLRKIALSSRNIGGLSCAGKVSNSSEVLAEFKRDFSYNDLSSQIDLLDRRTSKVSEIQLNAYRGSENGEESVQVDLIKAGGSVSSLGRASMRVPIEVKFNDRDTASRVEVKCTPAFN